MMPLKRASSAWIRPLLTMSKRASGIGHRQTTGRCLSGKAIVSCARSSLTWPSTKCPHSSVLRFSKMKRYLVASAVTVLFVAYWLYRPSQASATSGGSLSGGVYAVAGVKASAAGKAVEFMWTDADGRQRSFSEVAAGKTVLLNIWATWCPPCRREIPDLVTISKEMAGRGVVVIGVALDDKPDALNIVKTYSEKNGVAYMNVLDADKKIAEAYGGIQAVPTTFIINKQGMIAQKIVGSMPKDAFVAALEKAM
ncbi:MAG: TlpA family protein disulfide reductase [Candidatus Kapabacteria bacterium]|nr:TlpA family protein disulfide reductase [Candidatus Kapabacteria bacterium]